MRDLDLIRAAVAVGFAGVTVFSLPDRVSSMFFGAAAGFGQNCDIKGNISMDSGVRIYHVPGQRYYSDIKIRTEFGERWFCSEDETAAAVWRKSRV